MRLIYVANVGALFSLPLYILTFCQPPYSIVIAFAIWSVLLIFFMLYFDENGDFHG